MQAIKHRRPYLLYRHSDLSITPRPLHVSWDGLIVRADDPWVQTHWPPNGWGCRCKMFAVGERDLAKSGKSGPDTPPDDGTRTWVDKVTGEAHQVPRGIDPGWDYAPGASQVERMRREISRKVETLPKEIGAELRAAMATRTATQAAEADAVRYVLANGAAGKVEFAAAYDANGKTILRKRGETDSVGFTIEEQDQLRAHKQPVVVHNHNKEGSLSIDDWLFHAGIPLHEIVAVTPSGMRLRGAVLDHRKVAEHYVLLAKVVGAGLYNIGMADPEVDRLHAHAINRVMAALGWVRYEATEPNGTPMVDSPAVTALIEKIVAAAKPRFL